MLVTPELAPIFRGKEDELSARFAIITRVLDGQGLTLDSGTHGRRGYRGDYLFAWIGCTTPIPERAWRVMAQLGSRLFFWRMNDGGTVTVDDLLEADGQMPYRDRLERCKRAVHGVLSALFAAPPRAVVWGNPDSDPNTLRTWIARLALLLAAMRSEPAKSTSEEEGIDPAKREQPWRAQAVLRNLARGRALVYGRRSLSAEDLPLVARVTVSSMPTECARVFEALARNGVLVVAEAQVALGARHAETARKAMRALDARGVAEFAEEGQGRPATLTFRPDWAWCASPEFRALLFADRDAAAAGDRDPGMTCHESGGVRGASHLSPFDLAERQIERGREAGGGFPHTPANVTSAGAGMAPETRASRRPEAAPSGLSPQEVPI